MRIERLSLYAVDGVATLPAETIELVDGLEVEMPGFGDPGVGQTARLSALLTTSVDSAVLAIDRRTAIANLILGGGLAAADDAQRLDAEIARIRSRRRDRNSSGPFLVSRLSKEVESPQREPSMSVIKARSFDLIVEGPGKSTFLDFKRQAQEIELRLLGAMKLMVNTHFRHVQLSTASYLMVDDRIEYRVWIDGVSGEFSVALNLTFDAAAAIGTQLETALAETRGSAVLGLIGHAGVRGVDQTVEFLVCFTALEQFVKRTVHSGELVARFKTIATARAPSADAGADVEEFCALYSVRNNLAHQGHLPSDRSYADRTRALLARYMEKPAP
jgi:hypothetical protein